ncbi:hypothetical protein QNI23_005505 [Bermanella sp. WJH001]|uniref:hypothetical protein n=1 Tax=Bermanella sp. WJH001 TaxID=3048005 RepID=UPI0024BEC20A|nr:hypothetical protein [Bermanella sp. WJH001]MDJ1539411.1 hypothetical protein [Bermanella sp. WJH001]
MNIDKATKLIAKRVKKGLQGYPSVTIQYFGDSNECASEVVIGFTEEEGIAIQAQSFSSKSDARFDETIQTTLLKIIERSDAKTVIEVAGITVK